MRSVVFDPSVQNGGQKAKVSLFLGGNKLAVLDFSSVILILENVNYKF
jgi:hypothetical protein